MYWGREHSPIMHVPQLTCAHMSTHANTYRFVAYEPLLDTSVWGKIVKCYIKLLQVR